MAASAACRACFLRRIKASRDSKAVTRSPAASPALNSAEA